MQLAELAAGDQLGGDRGERGAGELAAAIAVQLVEGRVAVDDGELAVDHRDAGAGRAQHLVELAQPLAGAHEVGAIADEDEGRRRRAVSRRG